MSEENVETVRRFLQALDRGEYDDAVPCLHQSAEWHNTVRVSRSPDTHRAERHSRVLASARRVVRPSRGGTEVEHFTARGDRVVMGVRTRGRGATSRVPIDVRWALGISMRNGRIERVDVSGDYTKALEAAGLSE